MTKRKGILIAFVIIMLCTFSGCANHDDGNMPKEPDILQVRNICNLATLDCYYHNVAKTEKQPGTGIAHIGEKSRTFWVEYTGVARLGINMSQVEMTIAGENIEITLPEAEVLSISVVEQTLNEESFISSEDGWNNNKITADDQIAAIKDAQAKMEKTVRDDETLLLMARDRAKKLIENYITQLGEAAGVQYNISWKYAGRRDGI